MDKNLFSLKGKNVLITGAAGYLGVAMSRSLAEAGAQVLMNGRNEKKIRELVNEMQTDGLLVESAVFDITRKDEITSYFENRGDTTLDVLVNNAYSGTSGSVETSLDQNYRDSYEITVVSAHNLLQVALPFMRKAKKKNGDASVINICSMYGMVSPDTRIYDSKEVSNPPFYGSAKAALIQWTKYAACELGIKGIRVNAISPGAFPSEQVKSTNPQLIKKIENKVPMGRVGLPEELKGPVLFLASPASSYVNGANLVVDGGWTAW